MYLCVMCVLYILHTMKNVLSLLKVTYFNNVYKRSYDFKVNVLTCIHFHVGVCMLKKIPQIINNT